MALSAGTILGPYEIVSPLGAGGMGEVYRARDTKLNRDVALKVLPELFALDPDRLARFKREAQVLASLSHPNIAVIHGFEEMGGVQALALELVAGPTLADRIAQGPLPPDEALPIARQIAEALEAAHEQGIIHRDLKPANIKVRPDGTVKVLDFGLAKALESGPVGTEVSQSPTLTSPLATRVGVLLGTAPYMAPEQARGKPVDKRADMWAFGCVLYEMLTGERAFPGEDVAETLAAVIKGEPDLRALPGETPAPIRRLIRRCLTKDPRGRIADASIARIEIDEAQIGAQRDGQAAEKTPRRRERLVWISALTLFTLVAGIVSVWVLRPATPAPEARLDITTPATTDPVSLAISPDGQKMVFAATSEGRVRLWLRSLDSVAARPLAGTDFASLPFWSPDSRSVGFFADGKLKRIDIDGGSVRALASAPNGEGGTWNREGTILVAPNVSGQIFRIPEGGGEPAAVTQRGAPPGGHRYPQFLPDGRRFLFYVAGVPETRGIYVARIDGSETQRLMEAESGAVYTSSGDLLFVRQGTLFAQGFDPVRLVVTGTPRAVAEQVTVDWRGRSAMSASAAGPIAYRAGSTLAQRQFVWLDRSGKAIEKVGEPDEASALCPSISPDGRRVALHRAGNGNIDIWLLEIGRGVRRRFTFHLANEVCPVWSPDGSRIVFGSLRTGSYDLYLKSVTGAGAEELLHATPQSEIAMDWSPDGRFILYRITDPKMGMDIWALPLDGDRRAFRVVQTEFDENIGQFSPDGRWIAYESNKSGRLETYVQPFPGPGAESQISTNGGAQVRWRRDGKELFYIALDNRLMAVPIRIASDGQAVDAGSPVPLFATHVGGAVQWTTGPLYMVSPDGQRFLMNTLTAETSTSPITVILNWKAKR